MNVGNKAKGVRVNTYWRSEISQDKVKIAINAPKEIKVTRKELAETCEFNVLASGKINKISLNEVKNKLNSKKIK